MAFKHQWVQSWRVLVMGAFWLLAVMPAGAHAQSSPPALHSYAAPAYYLGADGQPPTLQELAQDQRKYFRNRTAYRSFRSILEAPLPELLADGMVRTVPCGPNTRIETSGLTAAGEVRWFTRACYAGEELIQVQDADGWQTVVSLGCLNLVRRVIEPTPVSPPPEPEEETEWGVLNAPPQVYHVPEQDICTCTNLPARTVDLRGARRQPSTGWHD